MKKIIFATNNINKLTEILPFLQGFSEKQLGEECEILTFNDLGVDIDVEEGTESLYINAAKKAKEAYDELVKLGKISIDDIVIAEDSGLFGKLSGYPGVVTKRELEEHGLEQMLDELIIRERRYDRNVNTQNLEAYYESVLAFYSKDFQDMYVAEETGVIMKKPIGEYNYPIDKHFKSDKRGHLGELTPEEFSKTSFRQNGIKLNLTKQIFAYLDTLDYNYYEFAVKSDVNDADYGFTTVKCSKHDIYLLKALEDNSCQEIYEDESIDNNIFAAILGYTWNWSEVKDDCVSFDEDCIEEYLLSFLGFVEPSRGHNSHVYGTTEQIETMDELHEIQHLEKELNKLLSSTCISEKLRSLGRC